MLKDAIDLSAIHRVLVIKLRHHGDVLLSSPVFSVLKNHAPHLEIDALVYRDTAEMLTFHPAISQVHTIDRKWKSAGILIQASAEWRLLSTLRGRRYDLIVHLTEHPRGAWIKRLTDTRWGVARRLSPQKGFWQHSFTHLYSVPRATKRHTVELDLDALRRIGVYPSPEERRLSLIPGDEAENSINALLQSHAIHNRGFIHIHPASRWFFKCWPAHHVRELVEALQDQGHHIVLTAAPTNEEMAMVKDIQAGLRHPAIDLSGQLSLKQLAALTAQALLFIGVDSAPMHIAAAVQTPCIALFGPSGEQEWGPWQVPHRVLTSPHSCRPCGNDGCGGGKISDCLNDISVRQVLDAVSDLLPRQ